MADGSLHPRKHAIDMSLNIWFLRVFGLMGLDSTCAWKHALHGVYCAAVCVSYVVVMTANVAGMVRDWGDFDAVISNVCMTVPVFSSLVKYLYFICKRRDIALLLRMLWEFETYQWPQCLQPECSGIIAKTSRHVRAMTLALSFVVFLVFLSWMASPFITAGFLAVGPAMWRSHPFAAAFFFDYQSSPSYEAVYCFQSASVFSFCLGASSFDTACVALLMQVGAQLRVLLASLGRLREAAEESLARCGNHGGPRGETAAVPGLSLTDGSADCPRDELKVHLLQYLRTCIKHHNDIIMFVKKLDDVFNPIMLAQILYSVFVIAVSGLQATESSADFGNQIKFVVLASTATFELYLFCRYADNVLHLSQEVAVAAYSCEWYHMDSQIKMMLQMMIMRGQSAVKLTAFRFRVMSLDLYGTLLNGAYTYFALLKEIKKRSAVGHTDG